MDLRIVDLFCGAGGLSEGFRQAGAAVIAGTDHDPDAMATYAANFPNAAAITGDITDEAVRQEVLEAAKDVDVIVGGPPCQAFSQVRNHDRLIKDPRNSLYREFVRLLSEARPQAFVMENVPGMAQMGVQDQVADDLSLGGAYRVKAQLLNAADFGVPQTRRRLIFIGLADGLAEPPDVIGTGAVGKLTLLRDPAAPQSYSVCRSIEEDGDELLGRLLDPADRSVVSAEQALSDLSWLETGRRADSCDATDLPAPVSAYQELMRKELGVRLHNVQVPRINEDTVLRLHGVPAGGNHRDLDESLLGRYLTGKKWGQQAGTGRLERRHYYAYRRLHPDIWSWTLNTKADSVYHYREARALSVREFARLQSFPDHFRFTTDARKGPLAGRISGGGAHSRYRQAGNAVPPLLASAIASAVAASLAAA